MSKGSQEEDLVFVALAQNQAERTVTTGESSGHVLRHVNGVRDFKVQENSSEKVPLQVPSDFEISGYHVIAFAQNAKSGAIYSANRSEIDPS